MSRTDGLLGQLLLGLRQGRPLRRLVVMTDMQKTIRTTALQAELEHVRGVLNYYADAIERQLDWLHLNPANQLPPVDCPLLIEVDGKLERVVRPSFVERRGQDLTYQTADGRALVGQFRWTYP